MEEQLQNLQTEYLEKINQADSLRNLDEIFIELFGKNGVLTLFPKEFPKLEKENLKVIAPLFNKAKVELEQVISDKREEIRMEGYKKLEIEKLDIGEGEIKKRQGYLHPITEFEEKIAELFKKIGFEQYDGPDIDTDEYNFGLLNIPEDHPARDMWDTLYIEGEGFGFKPGELLLRTHTSNSQPHIMREFKPPFRKMIIGRCFRYENLDARHEHTFDQFEIVYVEKGLSMAHLQYLSDYLLKAMYGLDISARLSPGYYPFTEPSAHLFGTCIFCKGRGCKICGETGELELGGAGMIHPNVLKNSGIDPDEYSGIAWGLGPLRMAMLKYNVNDVRLFNSGDLKFLKGLHESK